MEFIDLDILKEAVAAWNAAGSAADAVDKLITQPYMRTFLTRNEEILEEFARSNHWSLRFLIGYCICLGITLGTHAVTMQRERIKGMEKEFLIEED